MKEIVLQSVNHFSPLLGLTETLGINGEDWNGYTRGIAIGTIDQDGNIFKNYLSSKLNENDREKYLKQLIANENIVKLAKNTIYELDDGSLKEGLTTYYVPYAVKGHSIFEPTINFESAYTAFHNNDDEKKTIRVYMEIVIVTDHLNRYFVSPLDITSNDETNMIDMIHRTINNLWDIMEPAQGTVKTLDMYSDIGDKTMTAFVTPESIEHCVVSARIIRVCECIGVTEKDLDEAEEMAV